MSVRNNLISYNILAELPFMLAKKRRIILPIKKAKKKTISFKLPKIAISLK